MNHSTSGKFNEESGCCEGRTARRRSRPEGSATPNSLSSTRTSLSLGRSGQWKLSSWNHVAEGYALRT